jgi:hypothetical protein
VSYLPMIPWCGVARYPHLQPFLFGTVTLPSDARQDQIEAAVTGHALLFLPPGFTLIECKRGSIFFAEEDPQI